MLPHPYKASVLLQFVAEMGRCPIVGIHPAQATPETPSSHGFGEAASGVIPMSPHLPAGNQPSGAQDSLRHPFRVKFFRVHIYMRHPVKR